MSSKKIQDSGFGYVFQMTGFQTKTDPESGAKIGCSYSFNRGVDGIELTLDDAEVGEVVEALNDLGRFGNTKNNFGNQLNGVAVASKSPNVQGFLNSALLALSKDDGSRALDAQRVSLSATGVQAIPIKAVV